jgi:hypothetical protein
MFKVQLLTVATYPVQVLLNTNCYPEKHNSEKVLLLLKELRKFKHFNSCLKPKDTRIGGLYSIRFSEKISPYYNY